MLVEPLPAVLNSQSRPTTALEFRTDVTDAVGPLFIALDDIGTAFEGEQGETESDELRTSRASFVSKLRVHGQRCQTCFSCCSTAVRF
jgi:hypothetical protein